MDIHVVYYKWGERVVSEEKEDIMNNYWIPKERGFSSYIWVCSGCKEVGYDVGGAKRADRQSKKKTCSLKFCPNCGSPMEKSTWKIVENNSLGLGWSTSWERVNE